MCVVIASANRPVWHSMPAGDGRGKQPVHSCEPVPVAHGGVGGVVATPPAHAAINDTTINWPTKQPRESPGTPGSVSRPFLPLG